MKHDSTPAALLILVIVILVFLQQATIEGSWSPPYLGRNLDWNRIETSQNALHIDTAGLRNLPALSFLPHPLPALKQTQLMKVTPEGSEIVSVGPGGLWVESDLHRGFPRIKVEQSSDSYRLTAHLYQPETGMNLFSGPIEGWLDTELYRPETEGVDPSILSFLPRRTERAVLIDTRGLQLPAQLRSRLISEWKRWEFEPYVSLAEAFGPAFCYAEWEGQDLLVADVKSREQIDNALQRRFPPKVIEMTSTWAFGTPVWGFEQTSKPAWTLRGDRFIATTSGGTSRLADLLSERYLRNYTFVPRSPLLKEMNRLASGQKGWHVWIIEQASNSQIHWAALLRWPEAGTGKLQGYLVVWLPPQNTERENKS